MSDTDPTAPTPLGALRRPDQPIPLEDYTGELVTTPDTRVDPLPLVIAVHALAVVGLIIVLCLAVTR